MYQVAPDVYLLPAWHGLIINAYLIGDVLVDAGIRSSAPRLLRQLRGHAVRAHALTHAHSDHQGASHAMCETLKLPLWTSELEVQSVEHDDPPSGRIQRVQARFWRGPAHPVSRILQAGDEVAGFEVLSLPGHSAGMLGFWRERDRVLLVGDVLVNLKMTTGQTQLNEPPVIFTDDPERNRQSIRQIAALNPALTLFGHGPPLRDPAQIHVLVEKFAR